MRRWAERYARAPSSYDWSRTHARRHGDQALRRLESGDWPAPATVTKLYGTWARAAADAFADPAEPGLPTGRSPKPIRSPASRSPARRSRPSVPATASTRLHFVLDNFSPHKGETVCAWAAANNVGLAYTPFYASWLNRIEAQFRALRCFTLAGTDHPDHAAQARLIRRYIAWRNRNTDNPASAPSSTPANGA